MGKAELVAKILSDGQARAAAIKAECDLRCAEVESRTRAELARLEAEAGERLKRETGAILERARSTARLQRRARVLAAKWAVLDQVAQAARQQVLSAAWYPELVRGIIQRYAGDGAEVRLSPDDTRRLGSSLPPGTKLGEPVRIDGGVVIRRGREELGFALGETIAALRDQLVSELSRMLFSD